MKVYHGSDIRIDTIDLSKSKPGKDFGRGFYEKARLQMTMLLKGYMYISEVKFQKTISLMN